MRIEQLEFRNLHPEWRKGKCNVFIILQTTDIFQKKENQVKLIVWAKWGYDAWNRDSPTTTSGYERMMRIMHMYSLCPSESEVVSLLLEERALRFDILFFQKFRL